MCPEDGVGGNARSYKILHFLQSCVDEWLESEILTQVMSYADFSS